MAKIEEFNKPVPKLTKLFIVAAFLPWIGIPIRLFISTPATLTVIGIVLWMAGLASRWYVTRFAEEPSRWNPWLSALAWSFTFCATYMATVLLTGALLSRAG